MNAPEKPDQRLQQALQEHSAEGIAILASEPSRLQRHLILVMFGLLLAAVAWSFIGRADVTVTADGVLGPASEEQRIYAPVDGELVEVFIAEGMPISRGDVLARVNALNAVELATRAVEARLRLDDAERQYALLPTRLRVIEQQLELLEVRSEAAQVEYEKSISEALAKLAEEQRIRLQQVRARLEEARNQMVFARDEAQRYQRLHESPGGGGLSRQQVDARRQEYLTLLSAYEIARTELAQFEVDLGREHQLHQTDMRQKRAELLRLQAESEEKRLELTALQEQVQAQLRIARASYEGAARVTFDDIDADNFLLVRAPASGVITRLDLDQPGDKVGAATPIASVTPAGSRTVLNVWINERDRAFLREGMPVKLKFAAFPYQRYGFIEGQLEYIAPSARMRSDQQGLAYQGRIALQRESFPVGGEAIPLRYGMSGTAEIAVRKRRLIDLALDPLREATAW
ncbi:MAG: HlyD family efflux transporter periplasmic adaptor subunit [Ectothiorhodospiraceae bacterium]|nr:HlyD family efflux transporter periplasmic adaptor subunit [Ectothiorhodospiraceae bacterium]